MHCKQGHLGAIILVIPRIVRTRLPPPPHLEAAPYSAVAVGQIWLVVLGSLGQVWRWVHRVWGGAGGEGRLVVQPVSLVWV